MSYYFTRNEIESHHEANLEEDPLGTGEQRVQQQWKCDLLIGKQCSYSVFVGIWDLQIVTMQWGAGITNN